MQIMTTSFPKLRIQHRETGCWLSVTSNRALWVSCKDIREATTFNTADDAKHAARYFELTSQHYRITSSTSKP